MLPVKTSRRSDRRTSGNNRSDLKLTGEPDAGKLARPVRRGVVGKVLLDSNSLATYPTLHPLRQFWQTCPLITVLRLFLLSTSGYGRFKCL